MAHYLQRKSAILSTLKKKKKVIFIKKNYAVCCTSIIWKGKTNHAICWFSSFCSARRKQLPPFSPREIPANEAACQFNAKTSCYSSPRRLPPQSPGMIARNISLALRKKPLRYFVHLSTWGKPVWRRERGALKVVEVGLKY